MKNKLIWGALTLLGFSSACEELAGSSDMYGPAPMYAPLYSYFSVKGKVVDPDGKPIPGIGIMVNGGLRTESDADGKFKVEGNVGNDGLQIRLGAVDIDGHENGLFEETARIVDLQEDDSTDEPNDFTADEQTIVMQPSSNK